MIMAAVNESVLLTTKSQLLTSIQAVEDILVYFPDNPLRDPFGKAWMWMTDGFTPFQIASFGSMIVHQCVYFGICFPAFMFQFLPFMQRFKIQKNKTETLPDQWKCFKLLMFSQWIIQFPLIFFVHAFNEKVGIPQDWASMPRWYIVAGQMGVCFVIEDAWHYWIHRLAHHPSLYKHVHKIHHSFPAPFGMIAEYAHPAETLVLGTGFFIALLTTANHLITLWMWVFFRLLETIDVHSGYDVPFINPLHLLPGYAGIRFHDFHHYNFVGNYAPTFTFWDRVCGTDWQYKEFLAKQQQQKKLQ